MQLVEPKTYIVSLGEGFDPNFYDFLKDNQIKWRPDPNVSFLENIYEFAGRLCYESWEKEDGTFANKNLTKVREGNDKYLDNILSVKHGSVLEHGGIVILFNNVSRVFTHELVRHRAGTAMSQTSGRYVRYDNIKFWIPPSLKKVEHTIFHAIQNIETAIGSMSYDLYINDPKLSFNEKKKLTSALRRITPNGIANNILFSFNGRSLRHVFQMRSSEHAEEEMRFIFNPLIKRMKEKLPNLLQDISVDEDRSIYTGEETFKFKYEKV